MDYNDIKARMERTFSSINERFDEDINKHTNVELWKNGKGFSLTFGNTDKDVILNKIFTILHNLSSLKDHLKLCLKKNGYDSKLVELEIDKSIHLQVLIDIVNQEKHGAPLKRPRSNKNPVIDEPTNNFRLARKMGDVTEINFTNEGKVISHGSPPTMFIDAIIRDDKGNLLFRLDELVETSFNKWLEIAKKYNCS